MLRFDVSISYDRPILDRAAFVVPEGCIAALLGKNGAGKSTLLSAAIGLLPYRGEISFRGAPLPRRERDRAKIVSLLPQALPSPALSVRDVVSFGRYSYTTKLSPSEWKLVDGALERLKISELSARLVSTLSGGERQKVFLASLLVQDAPVLLLDEPTTYMDLAFRSDFYRILREERDKGKTVLLVTHDLSDAVAEADRIVLLEAGKVAFDGTKEECLARPVLEEAFSVRRYLADENGASHVFFR